jgi:capsular polysaccharide biosynthesis protein
VPGAPAQSRVLFLLLGLVVSLGAGIGLGFGLELLDPVVLDGQQLEALSGEPFLGSVPTL